MKRISSTDLSWEFFDRMRDAGVFRKGVTVAVLPDEELGWRAVIGGLGRKMTPPARKRFKELETELRATYSLSDR
jgi:hypothetical protein